MQAAKMEIIKDILSTSVGIIEPKRLGFKSLKS